MSKIVTEEHLVRETFKGKIGSKKMKSSNTEIMLKNPFIFKLVAIKETSIP
jgi:hypothetical protein